MEACGSRGGNWLRIEQAITRTEYECATFVPVTWLQISNFLSEADCGCYHPPIDKDIESWTTGTPLGPPSRSLFKRRWTRLTVDVISRAGDKATDDNVKRFLWNFLFLNPKYWDQKRFKRKNLKAILVADDIHDIPGRFSSLVYYTFVFLGLYIPYSMFLDYSFGHVHYRIDKKVFAPHRENIDIAVNPVENKETQFYYREEVVH